MALGGESWVAVMLGLPCTRPGEVVDPYPAIGKLIDIRVDIKDQRTFKAIYPLTLVTKISSKVDGEDRDLTHITISAPGATSFL